MRTVSRFRPSQWVHIHLSKWGLTQQWSGEGHKTQVRSQADVHAYIWKMCCSVLCPGLEDPSPKFHRKLTSVPALTRQFIVTVWFGRTDAWCRSPLSLTGLWMSSGKTSVAVRVPLLDTTKTTSYLRENGKTSTLLQSRSHSSQKRTTPVLSSSPTCQVCYIFWRRSLRWFWLNWSLQSPRGTPQSRAHLRTRPGRSPQRWWGKLSSLCESLLCGAKSFLISDYSVVFTRSNISNDCNTMTNTILTVSLGAGCMCSPCSVGLLLVRLKMKTASSSSSSSSPVELLLFLKCKLFCIF